MAFVHLHCHSQFSLLDGTATVTALAKRAAKLGMPALALTDTANMYGAVAFYKACRAEGIRPIIGAELHVQPEGLDHVDARHEEGGYHLLALIENDQGYQSLCRLVTAGIFDGMAYKPRVSLDQLREFQEGLIFIAGGPKGPLGWPMAKGDEKGARAALAGLTDLLGPEQLFLELQDIGLPHQRETNDLVRKIAAEGDYKTVVTNAAHYLDAKDAPILDVLNAISQGISIKNPARLISPTDQAWLKTEAEMLEIFPEDVDAMARTGEIAERCEYHFDFDTYHFPATTPPDINDDGTQSDTDANWAYFYRAFPPPTNFEMPGEDEPVPPRPEGAGLINGYFSWYAYEGLKRRLRQVADESLYPEYWERLDFELKVVINMGFPAYLLIVAEFINWSKDNEIPVGPGRGSAAGSLACWAMGITDIDPIRYGLLFERFLNPERVSVPDIDVDFCQDRREEAIEHVRKKYGTELVSQIITYGKLKAKAAIRDVARVLDVPFLRADRIAKLIPDRLGITLDEAIAEEPRLRALYEGDPMVRRLLDTALAVEGNLRHTGIHAAGGVIADIPLVNYAPLYRDEPQGGPVVQYDMKSAEGIGLIKFDFLGLKTLDQIRDAVNYIEVNHDLKLDMSAIPVDDSKTYTMLQEGDALGVFQLESSGMRDLLCRLRPSVIDDMVALVALYRPGPLQSGMTDDFVERKHGRTAVDYPLPMLEPFLKQTYGTIIYQEQVMQIAQVMAGYSLGEADMLRRAMGKKDAAEMMRQGERFVEGSVANNIDEEKASEIFDMMAKFAAYGFNKSHSAAYGYISYQTAYLKAHYRSEYMAALMTVEAGNTDKVLMYILDCRKAGMQIDPVCVNYSERQFSVPRPEDRPLNKDGTRVDMVRFGLAAVKNVGTNAILAIIEARKEAGGRFKDAFDFFERIDYKRVNKRVIENLVRAGAMDWTGLSRASVMAGVEGATKLGARRQTDKAAGQMGLFAMMGAKAPSFRFPDVPEWTFSKRMKGERDSLGLYLTGHPMQAHKTDVERYASAPIIKLSSLDGYEEVRLLGLPVEVRTMKTRRGDKMAFVRMEDDKASVECTFFSEAWFRSQSAVESGEPVLITGKIEVRDDEAKILASTAQTLSQVRARGTRQVSFELNVDELAGKQLEAFVTLISAHRGGCRSRMILRKTGEFEATLVLPEFPVEPSAQMEEQVNAMFRRPDVVVLS
ncbi:MAG: DNA polymerase III subunit alpha [Rhodobacterales bacterium]|nr:DNA polymerase III subunit alpha [Rhodobacterales bacterium]